MSRTLLKTLTLPYESVKTLYEGDSEVRLYRNEITRSLQVGKRIDTLGLEAVVAYREATWLKRIRHPNIVPVEDVTRVDGYDPSMNVIELIMPYYERGSVFDCFERGERFTIGQAVGNISNVLTGLRELHEVHRILHRDIKSPNVLLEGNRGLLGDLGVAVPMEADGSGPALDSPRLWAPPETYVPGRADTRSDLYQVGLVLHEMASGPLPYAKEPDYLIEQIAKRLQRGSRAIRGSDLEPAPWVPPALRRVIRKATARRAHQRYPSARQMLDAVRRAPFVDWRLVCDEPDRRRWEGATPQRPDRDFHVEVVRRRRGGWVVSGRQRKTAWQRARPDQIVDQPDGDGVKACFDEMVAIATKV